MKRRGAVDRLWAANVRSPWHPGELMRRGFALALSPLSLVFRGSTAMRRRRHSRLAEASPVAVPVVVVGNITVGGAGKTPLVIALVHALRQAGFTPGVVSRGYGGSETREPHAVDASMPDAADTYGDEPVLIRRRADVPVFVGRRRADAASALLAAHPDVDVLLSDDGLQHYAMSRAFEIAVFDDRGAGNGRLLPAGPLREPLTRLGEVDAVVLNGTGTRLPELPDGVVLRHEPFRMELTPGDAYNVNQPATTRPLDGFRGRRLTAAAGIGNPQRFFALLRGVGLSFHRMPLADHHRYRDNPFSRRNSEAVLMTEKDAVKCARFAEPRMWAVPVTATVDTALFAAILSRIGTPAASTTAPATV